MSLSLREIRQYCLKKPGKIVEDFPFGEATLVVKVFDKAFLLADITGQPVTLNLKCEPDLALELRARYDSVRPGYHMNKRHWNTVTIDGSIPTNEILGMIDHSFGLVVKGLPRATRRRMTNSGSLSEKKRDT